MDLCGCWLISVTSKYTCLTVALFKMCSCPSHSSETRGCCFRVGQKWTTCFLVVFLDIPSISYHKLLSDLSLDLYVTTDADWAFRSQASSGVHNERSFLCQDMSPSPEPHLSISSIVCLGFSFSHVYSSLVPQSSENVALDSPSCLDYWVESRNFFAFSISNESTRHLF